MPADESFEAYEPPFDTDESFDTGSRLTGRFGNDETTDPATSFAADAASGVTELVPPEEAARLAELAEPFVGQWNRLISQTNWEKGQIISEWRQRLIESDAPSTEYSDEAWSRRVGGVTAPHVGRLRRVYDRFADSYESYDGLYWSHFLAALDWEDAPLWLEGASREGWSVSQMREQRWQAHGAVESQRPTASQVVEVDVDEDIVLPAQGGGRKTQSGDDPGEISAGPKYEEPDFGDGDELTALGGPDDGGGAAAPPIQEDWEPPVQPFAGLPELPDDLADAIEQLKLAILRHKTSQWQSVTAETVREYLDAMALLLR